MKSNSGRVAAIAALWAADMTNDKEDSERHPGQRAVPPSLCLSYAKVQNEYCPHAYCSLDKAARHIQLLAHTPPPRKGNVMHKYPQNQSSVGSSGQTITTNVSMSMSLADLSPKPCLMQLHYIL